MYNSRKKKMPSILGYTLTGDLPGTTHFRKTERTWNNSDQNVLVTRTQVKTLHKQQTSAYQILGVIAVFVVVVRKSHSQKPQEAFNLLVTEERY
jgi:N6-adenosine-specific RNA methylase IME4